MSKNPIKQLLPFKVKVDCDEKVKKSVNFNANIFSLLLVLILVGNTTLVVSLLYGMETTIIFQNDDSILGLRTGRQLASSEYPTQPLAVYKNDSGIYYANWNTIHRAWIQMLGFVIMDESFFTFLMEHPIYYSSLYLYVKTIYDQTLEKNANITGYFEKNVNFDNLESNIIQPYFENNTIILVFGNFANWKNHDVIFKITSGKYIIPIFTTIFQVVGLYEPNNPSKYLDCAIFGFWRSSQIERSSSLLKRGLYQITITTVLYNYNDAYSMLNYTSPNFPNLETTGMILDGVVSQSYNLKYIFTPVTQYSETPILT